MKKQINCIHLKGHTLCRCKHIKRSMWGIGTRDCTEYNGKVRICSFKELNVIKSGRYLVKFVEPERDMFGVQLFPNDFKSAKVSFPFKNDNQIIYVNWDNGHSARIDKKHLKFKYSHE